MPVDLELPKTIVEQIQRRVRVSRRTLVPEIREKGVASRMLSREISNRAPERKIITFRGREMFRVPEHLKTEMRGLKMETDDRKTEMRGRKQRLVRALRKTRLRSEGNRRLVQARRTITLRQDG
jgi:hypothetical protein